MPTLSLILLGLAVMLFATSMILRRPGPQNQLLVKLRTLLNVLILGLAAYYFYKRFTG